MAVGRPRLELTVSAEDRAHLSSVARSNSLPAGLVRRARIILLSASGVANTEIARRFGVTNATVSFWRFS